MKSAKSIIKHLIHKPQNSKLLELNCYQKIKKALPPHIDKSILFIYRKNKILFFVLNHPGIKMEIDYKHNLIKSLLNKIKDFDENCSDIKIDEIRSFVSNKIIVQDEAFKDKQRYYKEKSNASFEIDTQNQKLYKLFSKIKEVIKENAKTYR